MKVPESSDFSFSKLKLGLFGLVGWGVFAGFEAILSLFFSGKYWEFYFLSVVFWAGVGLTVCFLFIVSTIVLNKVFSVFFRKKLPLNVDIILLVFLSLMPGFFYSLVKLNNSLPSHRISALSLGMDISLLFLFSLGIYYLYNSWKNRPKKDIVLNFFLVVVIFGGMSTSGVFLLTSELHQQHWPLKVGLLVISCVVLPFLSLIILNLVKDFNYRKKMVFAVGLLFFIFLLEKHILIPNVYLFAFQQKTADKNNAESLRDLPNVILIVMDTARAESMSLYGYSRNTTPNLERFAKDSVTFTDAISSAPWTCPSHASLFTGHFSYIHGATHASNPDIHAFPLDERYITLAELLLEKGYSTGAVVANQAYLAPWTGLNQGFQYYWWGRNRDDGFMISIVLPFFLSSRSNNYVYRITGLDKLNSSKRINQIALNWLKKEKEGPFFLFINYMEAHGFNYLPEPYSELFASHPAPAFPRRNEVTGLFEVKDEELDRIRSWYDNEITFLDKQIGDFFSSLKDLNLYDQTMIIVTSDHGELLGEHDEFGHEYWLYNELLHVPLIVKYPHSKREGEVFDKPVQNVDIFAELLDLIDTDYPANVQGQPFNNVNHTILSEVKRVPSSSPQPPRYDQDLISIYSTKLPQYKLIRFSSGKYELYNRKQDPKELNIIQDSYIETIIQDELKEFLNSLDAIKREMSVILPREKKMDKTTKERLKALGYIK